jgi:RimJ/RimL family protein N-acetyltransferase
MSKDFADISVQAFNIAEVFTLQKDIFFSQCFISQQVVFRPYTRRDRCAVLKTIQSIGAERQYLFTDRYISTPDWEHALNTEPFHTNHALFILEHQQALIGFVRLFPDGDDSNSYSEIPRAGNIGIAIMPQFRSRRIGTQALEQMIVIARWMNYARLTANILASNFRSVRLFKGRGFVETERRQLYLDYLKEEVDELVMSLIIS